MLENCEICQFLPETSISKTVGRVAFKPTTSHIPPGVEAFGTTNANFFVYDLKIVVDILIFS